MKDAEIKELLRRQREFFSSGATLDVSLRLSALRRLYEAILKNRERINRALLEDLGKSEFEGDMCEISLTLSEITYFLKHLKKFSKAKRVKTPLSSLPGHSFIIPSPYGQVLIMSPWNYPFLLTMEPLVDAIAAGNTVILKPSDRSQATTNVIAEIISSLFDSSYVAAVKGGRDENQALLENHFDYIFFTGGKRVGRIVLEKASKNLTPVTLELGGKSPCIVLKDADISLAARRIVFGKYLNLGQTCVAPDYILCDNSIRSEFITAVIKEIKRQFGEDPLSNDSYGRIINRGHLERLISLLDSEKVVYGGVYNLDTLKLEPTVMADVGLDDRVMQEELFGPIMPILTFESEDQIEGIVAANPTPLALYIFTRDIKRAKYFIKGIGFGGGAINDVIVHLATSEMAFGGFGSSGMGSYHGQAGFDTFTHYKSILDRKCFLDPSIRYRPYSKSKHRLLKLFIR